MNVWEIPSSGDYAKRRQLREGRSDAASAAMFRGGMSICCVAFASVWAWLYGQDYRGVWWFFFVLFVWFVVGSGRAIYRFWSAGYDLKELDRR